MDTRWTVEQLESCTTHELADLLSNLVVLLRRLPDVPVTDLRPQPEILLQEEHTRIIREIDCLSVTSIAPQLRIGVNEWQHFYDGEGKPVILPDTEEGMIDAKQWAGIEDRPKGYVRIS